MKSFSISAVSYLNTYPFVYGIRESGILKDYHLELDVPSVCADKLHGGRVDIALIPAGALPDLGRYHLISNYCIGAVGEVKTVLLLSKVPMEKITRIYLDYDSRTSVELVRILAGNYWKISPEWEQLRPGQSDTASGMESLVAIGDKTFRIMHEFPYVYDLASEWVRFTGLPFVFAVWASREKLPDEIISLFCRALSYGINNKSACLDYFRDKLPAKVDCLSYLENSISYELDTKKLEGLELFLSYLKGRH